MGRGEVDVSQTSFPGSLLFLLPGARGNGKMRDLEGTRFDVSLIDYICMYGPYGDSLRERDTPLFRLQGARFHKLSCHESQGNC